MDFIVSDCHPQFLLNLLRLSLWVWLLLTDLLLTIPGITSAVSTISLRSVVPFISIISFSSISSIPPISTLLSPPLTPFSIITLASFIFVVRSRPRPSFSAMILILISLTTSLPATVIFLSWSIPIVVVPVASAMISVHCLWVMLSKAGMIMFIIDWKLIVIEWIII